MSGNFLIYGSYGYTGALVADVALREGLRPILAGRGRAKVEAQAAAKGLEARVFGLDDARALDAGLEGCAVVIHCAGPFAHTARAMAAACLRAKAHYLDITGEIEVFEALARMDGAAREAGAMLLPGAGFDVVPSDCLALHLKQLLPAATGLSMAFHSSGRPSHGTQRTIVENLGRGGCVRRSGILQPVPHAWKEREIDFGGITRTCMTIPWGDVSTAYYSTGIPNIEVFMAAPSSLRSGSRLMRHFGWAVGSRPVQALLKARIPAGGPSDAERAEGYCLLWGEASDDADNAVQARLRTPDGYTVTAEAAVLIARKALAGHAPAGFQTPAKAYGADLILEVEGTSRG